MRNEIRLLYGTSFLILHLGTQCRHFSFLIHHSSFGAKPLILNSKHGEVIALLGAVHKVVDGVVHCIDQWGGLVSVL